MGKFGGTLACHGYRNVVIEKAQPKLHSRECREKMKRLLGVEREQQQDEGRRGPLAQRGSTAVRYHLCRS